MVVVIAIIVFLGLTYWRNSHKKDTATTPKPSAQATAAPYREFRSRKYGFSFSYPSNWGDARVAPSTVSGKKGKAYDIKFSNNKSYGGFVTPDWQAANQPAVASSPQYDDCARGTYAAVVSLYRASSVCLVVAGTEGTPKAARIILKKQLYDHTDVANIELYSESKTVVSTAKRDLQAAFGGEAEDGFLSIARSIKEIHF